LHIQETYHITVSGGPGNSVIHGAQVAEIFPVIARVLCLEIA